MSHVYTTHRSHKQHPTSAAPTRLFNICTYNTRTLFEEHFDNFIEELEPIDNKPQFKWDIIGISETKLKDSFNTKNKYGHVFFNSGVDPAENRRDGVGFLVHKDLEKCVCSFNNFSERLCSIKLRRRFNNTSIIQAYAPTTSHCDEEIEQFYEQLQTLVDEIPRRDEFFIIGDFNGKVGGINEPSEIGQHSDVARGHNDRGERLVTFCKQNNLFITNTCFKHRRKHTWVSPGDRVRNTIDFIITRNKMIHSILDSATLSHPDISDHRLVRCKAKLENFVKRKKSAVTIKYDVQKLREADTADSFAQHVTENLNDSDNVQGLMDNIQNALQTAAMNVLGKKPSTRKHYITQNTINAIAEKHKIRQTKGTHCIEYKLAKSNVKKLCKIDKEKSIEHEHSQLSQLPINQQYFEAVKRIKLSNQKQVKGWAMRNKQNVKLISDEEILENWAEFYENLYASTRTTFTRFEEDPNDPIPSVTLSELSIAIHRLKNGKAPGPDAITSEMFKAGGKKLLMLLLKLVNLIIETRDIPEQMTISEIITLFKKGDRLNCANYRPISLLSHAYKLVMQIIYNRISGSLLSALPRNQAAYQRGRSTTEQIQTIQQLIEKFNEFNLNAVICFIDYTKAFDSLHQQKLWNSLKKHTDINPAYINILAKLYESSKARIRTDIGTTRLIDILRGVKQGDLASAILFCIALMVILVITLDSFDSGVSIGGEIITDKGYADDIAIVTNSAVKMNFVLKKLDATSFEYGLSINIPKTRGMLVGTHHDNTVLHINNQLIKIVPVFDYLGRSLSNNSDDTPAVKSRIGIGWDAFNRVKSILTSRTVSMKHKAMAYSMYVKPAVLYAAETIAWKKDLMHRIEVFQNHVMRWMTRTRLVDHVSLADLRKRTGIEPAGSAIIARKMQWYGHIKRSDLPVRQTIEGLVAGKRSRGRPRHRWRDDIKHWTKMNWQELNERTRDRTAWKKLTEETQSTNVEKA